MFEDVSPVDQAFVVAAVEVSQSCQPLLFASLYYLHEVWLAEC